MHQPIERIVYESNFKMKGTNTNRAYFLFQDALKSGKYWNNDGKYRLRLCTYIIKIVAIITFEVC